MKHLNRRVAVLMAAVFLFIVQQAHPCTWVDGYFLEVSALRGTVVGAKIGPLQYIRSLRQSFVRKNAKLSLYHYRRPINQRSDMPLVKTTTTDRNGHFDFGTVAPGHYTLVVDELDWGMSDWYDVEIKLQPRETVAVTIDVSPNFPDCQGGHEFIVKTKEHMLP